MIAGCGSSLKSEYKASTIPDTIPKTQDTAVAKQYLEKKGYHVLVYEGNPENYELTKEKLEQMPYKQQWQVQKIDPTSYIGKKVHVEKFLVNHHPLDVYAKANSK